MTTNIHAQRRLGGTEVEVNAIGLGGMPLSIEGRPEEARAFEVIEAFIERGGDFIDTANVYCLDDSEIGHNERLIYKILKSLGMDETVLVATKGGIARPNGRWDVNGKPLFIRTSCEQSLKSLNTEIITLYQLHAVDPMVPFSETLGELVRLRDEGKIMHIGLSNIRQDQLKYALEHTAVTSVQNRCNVLFKEDVSNGMVNYCQEKHIAYIPYSPVGGHHGHSQLSQHPVLNRLSEKYSESSYCIALNWLLQLGDHVIPIPGASRQESVIDSARVFNFSLDSDDLAEIGQIGESR